MTTEKLPPAFISINERCPFCSKRLVIQKIKKDIFKSCGNCLDYKDSILFKELQEEPKTFKKSMFKKASL